jgi:ABC-type polysaccharide/polyol phosphate transport system ATPase subunit
MMSDILVTVNNISKLYSRSVVKPVWSKIMKSASTHGKSEQKQSIRFYALKDISFEVKRGEVLGVIGRNGAGKSTLLKILCGVTKPTSGNFMVTGRISPLIEIGAGFHPELTGRENIFLNAAIMGMTKQEIRRKFNAIVEFSELEDFIDTPVKKYSSGMRVRLGFSIAVHTDPDLLLVDEVLSVGDFVFQQKCLEKINDLRKRAATIFVSHNMRNITLFCDKTLVLVKGHVRYKGDSTSAVNFYLNYLDEERIAIHNHKNQIRSTFFGELFHNKDKITDIIHKWVGGGGRVMKRVQMDQKVTLVFSFRLLKPLDNLIIGIPIWDGQGNLITGISSEFSHHKIRVPENGIVKGKVVIDQLPLNPGIYISVFAVVDEKEFIYRNKIDEFYVRRIPAAFGFFTMDHRWITE